MTVEQDIINLQKQINDLKQESTPFTTAVAKNPFSKLNKLDQEQGSTGDATYRKFPLSVYAATLPALDSHGSLPGTRYHFDLVNSGTPNIHYSMAVLPSDYIKGGFPTLHLLWANTVASGSVVLSIILESFSNGRTSEDNLYQVQSAIAVPSATNTLTDISFDLVGLPDPGATISLVFSRISADGDDDNTGIAQIWSAWLEYLAYS